ncbi:SDR family oxidoreductase [Teredinibacter sp. KSP-S5-2]|uniref:SDR family oxidoreductase n=1 Tax=Teredinibacter sp. KSP-S5-2 TaxID=3034506 RepID=UPI002935108C|nr:SDR family oxidoreductase [Teredinibacter sp. KSP-S5-2]WNO10631.1 SDR family oxidoreductase [Teredinibacter sp. KSP-S5-2]
MKNKKVLIVGGSSGIGLNLAKKLELKGADVIIASRSAKEKQSELKNLSGLHSSTFYSVDITKEEDIKNLLKIVGNIDHLVLTVKSPLVSGSFLELNPEDVRSAFETKFWGQYNFAKLARKNINKNGSITLTSGTLGVRPYSGYSTMSIIAGAVDSLCKALAVELAPLRVNSVSPGYKTLEELHDKIPLGLGSDAKMSNPYLFLLEDSYLTGTSIVCDGGATLV